MRQEVKLLSERQEILKGMVEDKNEVAEQSKGKVLRAFFCGDEGAGRKEIRRGSDTCAENTVCGDTRMIEMKHDGCKDLEVREL